MSTELKTPLRRHTNNFNKLRQRDSILHIPSKIFDNFTTRTFFQLRICPRHISLHLLLKNIIITRRKSLTSSNKKYYTLSQ